MRHRYDKAIAAPGYGLDAAAVRSAVEHPAERRYLHRQVAVLDDGPRPDGGDDLVLRDDLPHPLDQHAENVERARPDRDRGEATAVIAPGQAAAPVEAEVLEQENVRRSERLHACSPAAASEACTEARPRRWVKALSRR